MRTISAALLASAFLLAAQEAAKPKFEIADIHLSPNQSGNRPRRASGVHGSRYDLDGYSMLDLIRTAYGFQADHIAGGPNWLEMTRYDVLAKIPPDSNADAVKAMLQSLLEQRFALKTHEETRPIPGWALVAGKKPLLKEGDGAGESGCRPQNTGSAPPLPGAGGPGGPANFNITFNQNGNATTLRIGSDGLLTYSCRNMSMAAFAQTVRTFFGANLGPAPILDETGLKGVWNFDIHYTFRMLPIPGADQGGTISLPDAIEKQLGLKLEKRDVPAKAIVVDSVNEQPTPNPPGAADALPPIALPTQFEIASVKLSETTARVGFRFNMAPGGRFTAEHVPLNLIVSNAFNAFNNREMVQGMPETNGPVSLDIDARVTLPKDVDGNDPELQATLLRSLLVERFGLKYHTEERPVTAYALVASKPKMKKADPASRAHCTQGNPMGAAPAGTRSLVCQNVTMPQLARQLQGMSQDVVWPVEDQTKLEGGYDFTLSFQAFALPNFNRNADQADDPSGAYTLLEAIDKQLGLKLEKVKRTEKVFVIDHIDTKPTEN